MIREGFFNCGLCHKETQKTWSDEQIYLEMRKRNIAMHEVMYICDDCHQLKKDGYVYYYDGEKQRKVKLVEARKDLALHKAEVEKHRYGAKR